MKTTKIQKFARGQECSLRIPGVCRQAPDNETTVLAHAPYPGRGGTRLHDWWGAPACSECHRLIDSEPVFGFNYKEIWLPAIHEWQEKLIKAELLIVKQK